MSDDFFVSASKIQPSENSITIRSELNSAESQRISVIPRPKADIHYRLELLNDKVELEDHELVKYRSIKRPCKKKPKQLTSVTSSQSVLPSLSTSSLASRSSPELIRSQFISEFYKIRKHQSTIADLARLNIFHTELAESNEFVEPWKSSQRKPQKVRKPLSPYKLDDKQILSRKAEQLKKFNSERNLKSEAEKPPPHRVAPESKPDKELKFRARLGIDNYRLVNPSPSSSQVVYSSFLKLQSEMTPTDHPPDVEPEVRLSRRIGREDNFKTIANSIENFDSDHQSEKSRLTDSTSVITPIAEVKVVADSSVYPSCADKSHKVKKLAKTTKSNVVNRRLLPDHSNQDFLSHNLEKEAETKFLYGSRSSARNLHSPEGFESEDELVCMRMNISSPSSTFAIKSKDKDKLVVVDDIGKVFDDLDLNSESTAVSITPREPPVARDLIASGGLSFPDPTVRINVIGKSFDVGAVEVALTPAQRSRLRDAEISDRAIEEHKKAERLRLIRLIQYNGHEKANKLEAARRKRQKKKMDLVTMTPIYALSAAGSSLVSRRSVPQGYTPLTGITKDWSWRSEWPCADDGPLPTLSVFEGLAVHTKPHQQK